MRLYQLRREIEALYTDTCTVTETASYQREDGSAGFRDTTVYRDLPCRLSFDQIKRAYPTDSVSHTMQTVRLFCPPDKKIRPGSRIEVKRQGEKSLFFKNSGLPAVYATHLELILEPLISEA